MKVTFDSNLYRRVTDPAHFAKDPMHDAYVAINNAILTGQVQPFLCATVVTLEAIGRDLRGEYLSRNRLKIDTDEHSGQGGAVEVRMTIGPDNSLHPGLSDVLERWLGKALSLGFKFLAAPRIGQPRPAILDDPGRFAPLDQVDFELFGTIAQAIEARGLGIAQARTIATKIIARDSQRLTMNRPWSTVLSEAADIHERRAIARAVAEWSDADAVAAHIAYRCDIFCTEDLGRSAGAPSVLAPEARDWLSTDYGLVTWSAARLSAELATRSS